MKNFSYGVWFLGQDLNLGHPKYKARVLNTEQQCSVRIKRHSGIIPDIYHEKLWSKMNYLVIYFCSVHGLPGYTALLDGHSLSLQQAAVLPPPHYFQNCFFDEHPLLDLKKVTT
jgi:hypothetical protein